MNRDRSSATASSLSWGRWEISICSFLLHGTRYLMPRDPAAIRTAEKSLLRVVLDDELLGQRHVDLGAVRQLVNQDALALPDHLQPAWHRSLPGGFARDLKRHGVQRRVAHVDDVVLGHPVAGDVHLHAVDR